MNFNYTISQTIKIIILSCLCNLAICYPVCAQEATVAQLENQIAANRSKLSDVKLDSAGREKLYRELAAQLNERAELHFDKGEYDLATKLFVEADQFTKEYNVSSFARNKHDLIEAENKLAEYEKADKTKRDYLLKAGRIMVSVLLSEVISKADYLHDVKSKKLYLERLVTVSQEANDSDAEAGAYEKLGLLQLSDDHPNEAFKLYDKAYKLRTNKHEEWWTVDFIAAAYGAIGEYDKAVEQYEKEIGMLRIIQNQPIDTTFTDLINLNLDPKELASLKKSRKTSLETQRMTATLSLSLAIINKARIRMSQGKFGLAAEAVTEVERLSEVLKEQQKKNHDETLDALLTLSLASQQATSLRVKGRILEAQGKDSLALKNYSEAVKLFSDLSAGKPSGAIASIRAQMALIYTNQKKFEEARSNIKEVLRLRARLEQEAGTVLALISSSRIERAANEKEAAMKFARQAKAAALQLSFADDVMAEANENEADNLVDKAVDANSLELEQAIVGYKSAIAVYRQAELLPMLARALSSLGWAYERSGKLKEAETSYGEAIKISESIKTGFSTSEESDAYSNTEETTHFYQRMVDLLVRQGKVEQALQYASSAQRRKLIDLVPKSEIKLTGKSAAELKNVTTAENRVQAVRNGIEKGRGDSHSTSNHSNLISSLGAAREDYALAIKRLETEQPNLRFTVRPTDLLKLQASILNTEAIISYLVTADKLYIFVVKHNTVAVRTVDLSQSNLRDLVAQVRNGLTNFANDFYSLSYDPSTGFGIEKERADLRKPDTTQHFKNKLAPLNTGLTSLHRYLVKPIEDLLANVETIKIIPNSELFLLPFAALLSPETNQYLIEKYAITYLTAGDLITSAPQQSKGSLVAFGNPTAANLEGAMDEVKAIKTVFPGGKIYTEDAATKEQLFKLKMAKILHFATHGHIQSPLENSNIQLAHLAGITDADLSYGEIYALPMESIEMVVLSACQTALGTVSGTEIGVFIEAFRSKTNTVVASLWSVDDISTLELMKEFYKNLESGKTKSTAMRMAQLKLLKDNRTKNPLFWSAFVMYGDGGKISGTGSATAK